MRTVNRRKALALTLGGAIFGVGASGLSGRRQTAAVCDFIAVTRSGHALGTEARITVRHPDANVAENALRAAFAELALVERLMSLYRPDSQICQLNRDGVLTRPHDFVLDVLRFADRISRRSQGAFDITVQPLWQLFVESARQGGIPHQDAVQLARQLVDYRNVSIQEGQVRFRRPGMAVTLNGIAQGYAADRVRWTLTTHGIEHALIQTGELSALGRSPRGDAWCAGIQHPRDDASYLALAAIDERALASSGDYATRFSSDARHHHILDPRTGYSATEVAGVSVVAPSAMAADALSTALMVLPLGEGLALLREWPDGDALFALKSGEMIITPGFPLRGAGRLS